MRNIRLIIVHYVDINFDNIKGNKIMLEVNRVYLGDCLEQMKLLGDNSIDCIITDLPYGTTWAKWDSIIDCSLLWKEYNRICKGAVILFSSQPFTTQLIHSNIKNYKYTWYWIKNIKGNYLNAKYQPLRQIEEINVFNKHNYYPQGVSDCSKIGKRGSGAKTTLCNYSDEWVQEKTNYPSNILQYDLDKEKYHPTQKPVELLEYLIKTYTNEGELILDSCMGSCVLAIAAINTNRQYIGFEMNSEYYELGNRRINKHIESKL